MRHPGRDDLAALSLGALDGREERSIAKHVEGCERCASELRDRFAPAVAVLAESVDQLEPPESLRRSLMAGVHEEARGGAEAPAPPAPRERSRLGAFLVRPAAGLAVLALGAAGVAGYLVAEDGGGSSADTVEFGSTAMGGALEIQEDAATLRVHGMPALSKGEVYQVWVAQNGEVVPSAAFVPHEDGTATAAVPEAVGGVDEVMVTEEPRPGMRSPTRPPVLDVRVG